MVSLGSSTATGMAWQAVPVGKLSPMRRAIGLVLMMIGLTWLLLGSGVIQGSVMSGQTPWAFVGGAIVIVGIGILTLRTGQRR